MKIGVLALQGAFIEHMHHLKKLGANAIEIRQAKDFLPDLDGIILPGGESTVMGKLLHATHLFYSIQQSIQEGLPVYGTCAGLILLAKALVDDSTKHLATMDIQVLRNAYGRQLGSFSIEEYVEEIGKVPMVFIRAPIIKSTSKDVKILATVNGQIVAARQKNQFVTAFHPELTNNLAIHDYFLKMCK